MVVALPVAAGAILIILIAFGLVLLLKVIFSALGAIPVANFFQNIGNWLDSAIHAVENTINSWVTDAAKPVAQLIRLAPTALENLATSVMQTFWSHWHWFHHILDNVIPGVIGDLTTLVYSVANQIYSFIAQVEAALRNLISSVYNQLINVIQIVQAGLIQLIGQVAGAIYSTINALRTAIQSEIDAIVNALRAEIATVFAELTATIASVENYVLNYARSVALAAEQAAIGIAEQFAEEIANLRVTQLATALAAGAADALAPALPSLKQWAKDIADAIPAELTGILPWVRALEADQAVDIASALGILSLVAAIPLRFMRDCGVNLCKNLSNFGDDLNNLENGLIFAALFAFTAEAIVNPEGTARATNEFVVRPFGVVADGMLDLVKAG